LGCTFVCQVTHGSEEEELVFGRPEALRRDVPQQGLATGSRALGSSTGKAKSETEELSRAVGVRAGGAEAMEPMAVDSDEEGPLPSEYSFFGGDLVLVGRSKLKGEKPAELDEDDRSTDLNDLSACKTLDSDSEDQASPDPVPVVPPRVQTAAFAAACADLPPPEETLDGQELVFEGRLPHSTLEGIRKAFMSDQDMICDRFMVDEWKCHDLKPSAWAPCDRMRGTWVRTCDLMMPVPSDSSAAISALVNMPEETQALMTYRCRDCGEEGFWVVSQNATPDVPFGDRFRVQDNFFFGPHPNGGVIFRRWAGVAWLTTLPLALKVTMKPILEAQTTSKSKAVAAKFARLVEETSAAGDDLK